MSINANLNKMKRRMTRLDLDSILNLVGLIRKRSVRFALLPALALVTAGVAVGVGIGMLVAPKSGRALRRQAEHKVSDLKERIQSEADRFRSEASESATP